MRILATTVIFLLAGCHVKPATGENHFPAIRERITPPLSARLKEKGLQLGAPIFLRAFKESRVLELWVESKPGGEFQRFETYPVCAASGDLGPKQKEGDRQVPEGFYATSLTLLNPASKYHLSFNIGYPNAYDRHKKRTGSLIMIHGNCVSLGCLAMTDEKIEEIYVLLHAALSKGQRETPVHIFPFPLKEIPADHEWADFWQNLKQGYDLFEKTKRPPTATLDKKTGRYVFRS